MAAHHQILTCRNILKATFLSCLEVLDATELTDAIDWAEGKAIATNFKQKPVPLTFTDSSKRLTNQRGD